jgi:hypothetical protein
MNVEKDFRDLFALFNAHGVEYMIVGGYALAFHGAPRYTGDMDIYVKADVANAQRVIAALTEFGFGSLELTAADFEKPDIVIQLGSPPVRINIMTSISGVSWEEAYAGRVQSTYGDATVYFIGRKQFVANKRSTGRKQDIADLEALGED